ncbi:unnamed protein product, partial [Coccothraustes coccothraustes]
FESCAENASVVRLRSSPLSSCRAVRLPEAKKRLLRAVSTVPVAVLSGERLLLEDARDRRLPSESSIFASSACQSDYILAESCSTLSHKEKLGLHRNLGQTFPLTLVEIFASRGLKESAKKRLLRALSTVPVAVLSGERLLPEDARDRRLPSESSIFASSACQSDYILAESCSTLSHKEKLGLHRNLGQTFPLTLVEIFASRG